MKKNINSLVISAIKNKDRSADGNLLPKARERVLKAIKEYLQHTGRLNISEIASLTCLSRQTVKNITNEILFEWQEENQDQILVQSKWLESVLKDIEDNPDTFGKGKIEMIKLKTMLFGKMNAFQKLLLKDNLSNINLVILKHNNPKEPRKIKVS